MRIFLTLLMSMIVTPVTAELRLNKDQRALLILAHEVWSDIGYPETGQAMLLQESSAGVFNIGDQGLSNTSYGPMQVNLPTARYVLSKSLPLKQKYFGKLSKEPVDELLITMLRHNDKFNIEVSAQYFKMIKSRVKDWRIAVGAYNAGVRGYYRLHASIKHKHVGRISKRIHQEVRPFNMTVGLN